MIDFIPLGSYSQVYYVILALFVGSLSVMLAGHPKAAIATPRIRNDVVRMWGWVCVAVMVALLGLRPISAVFGDMGNHCRHFEPYRVRAGLVEGVYGAA